jgi:hypothetical protein
MGDGELEGCFPLPRTIERERRRVAVDECRGPGVEFLLAGIEAWQDDRDRRPQHAARLAQPSGHRHSAKRKLNPLDWRNE